tara:strand:+ start:1003 stop:2049 length:1047 start_codon:yes stop_codon:yes gene_type:complete
MINRIKEWDIKNLKINDRQVISLALILSVMALVMAIPSSSNCASANTCTVASTGAFTGNLGIKSNTAYQLTQQHSLAIDQIANWEAVGGNHTGSVIMKDNSGDMNLNGGLVLGTSATSTNGTIRWNGSEVQVYNAGWSGIGGTPTDDIGQVTADSGSFTAATQQDNINIVGGTGITTSITTDTLTINASASAPTCSYYAYASSTNSVNSTEGVRVDTEYYDPDSCFTFFGSPGSLYGITYNGASTLVFDVEALVNFDSLNQRSSYVFTVNNTTFFSELLADGQQGNQLGHTNGTVVCLNQNDQFSIKFGNTAANTVVGSFRYQFLKLDQNLGLQSHANTQTCTDGLFN